MLETIAIDEFEGETVMIRKAIGFTGAIYKEVTIMTGINTGKQFVDRKSIIDNNKYELGGE